MSLAIIAFLVGQAAAAFYYWSLSPITYGLVLLGPAYALISLVCNLIEEKTIGRYFMSQLSPS